MSKKETGGTGLMIPLGSIGGTALSTQILGELTKGGDYFERLQLYQGSSGAAKEGIIAPGNYGIPKGDTVDDLGKQVDVLVFALRPKALDTSGETPVASYDVESSEFKRIRETAETVKDSGCMYGLEFLVLERTTNKFLTYFASSASARREAGKMVPKDNVIAVTLKADFIKKGKYSWHAPVITPCSTPFTSVPEVNVIKAKVEKFLAEKDDPKNGEEVKDGAKGSGRAR